MDQPLVVDGADRVAAGLYAFSVAVGSATAAGLSSPRMFGPLQWWWPLLVAAALAGLLVQIPLRRRARAAAVVVGGFWLTDGAWVAYGCAHGIGAGKYWAVWLAGSLLLIVAAATMATPSDFGLPMQAPAAPAAGPMAVPTGPHAEWEQRLATVGKAPGAVVTDITHWPTGAGYDVDADLPDGVTWEDVKTRERHIGGTLKLLPGCGAEVWAGAHTGAARITVVREDTLVDERPYVDTSPLTGAEGGLIPVGWYRDGSTAEIPVREDCTMCVSGTGGGKALALDTPLPTPTGWTTMGDVQAGDHLLDEEGRPCRVTRATGIQTGRTCYRVTFSDGSAIVADADHRWLTETRSSRIALRRAQTPQATAEVVTTEHIRRTLHARNNTNTYNNHSIRCAKPLDLPDADLPIDPHLLGLWLGDGTTANSQITTVDPEVVAAFETAGYQLVPGSAPAAACSYYIGRRPDGTAFRTLLRESGLLGHKHIPAAYLRGSHEQRLALLTGLMDSDGTVSNESNKCTFAVISEELADGFAELVVGLGWKAHRRKRAARLYGVDCGVTHLVTFRPTEPVFRIPRKLRNQHLDVAQGARHLTRYVTAVEPVPTAPVRCVQVDSPNSLYLAGNAMIPTHNSNWLHTLTAGHVRCPDVLVWHIDLGGAGLALPWARPYLRGDIRRPVVDWPAPSLDEALVMTEFALQVIDGRRIAFSDLMADENVDLIPISHDIPAIRIVLDETAEAAGIYADTRLKSNIIRIIQLGRAVAVRIDLSALRAVATVLPTDAQQQIGTRALFSVNDEAEVGRALGWHTGLRLDQIKHKGGGRIRIGSSGPIDAFRTLRTALPRTIAGIAAACEPYRPTLREVEDPRGPLAHLPLRSAYLSRWDRVVPLLTTGSPVSRPTAVAGSPARGSQAGSPGPGGSLVETINGIADDAARLVGRAQHLGRVDFDSEWRRLTGDLESDVLRCVGDDAETLPGSNSDAALAVLRRFGAAGASGTAVHEALVGAGRQVSLSRVYDYLNERAVKVRHGVYIHPDLRSPP